MISISGNLNAWQPLGGFWYLSTYGDIHYLGQGNSDTLAPCGSPVNQTMIRDVKTRDLELAVNMQSRQSVDKLIALRSADPGNQIEINIRAERPGAFPADLIVQEWADCKFTLLTPEFSVLIPPHQIGQIIHVHVSLHGSRLSVRIDGVEVLHRSFSFSLRTGFVGLKVLEAGLTAFDDVKLLAASARTDE